MPTLILSVVVFLVGVAAGWLGHWWRVHTVSGQFLAYLDAAVAAAGDNTESKVLLLIEYATYDRFQEPLRNPWRWPWPRLNTDPTTARMRALVDETLGIP